MAYTSIVDYLKAQGQASDYTSRQKLATQYGISNYTGTAAQNTQLLNLLQAPKATTTTAPAPVSNPTLPTGINLDYYGALTQAEKNNIGTSSTPVANTNTSSNLFTVYGNTQNGVVTNSAGMQVPTASNMNTPTFTPYMTDIKPNLATTPQTTSPQNTQSMTSSGLFSSGLSGLNNALATTPQSTLPQTIDLSQNMPSNFSLPSGSPTSSMDYSALLQSIQTMNQPSQRMTDLEASIAGLVNRGEAGQAGLMDQQKNIMDLTGQLATRGQKQFEAEKSAGVYDFQKQLNEVNSQIQQLQKENEITKLNAQGQPIAQEEINKQTADADRRYAVKALGLASIAQTIQGNLALAQDYANKSVEAEFSPIEAQLDYLKLALEYNKENFSREEKKRAEQLALMIDERERILTQEKEDKKSVFSIMQEAVKAGADVQTLNAIINSKNPTEALIAGASVFQLTGEDLSNAKVFGDSTGGYFRLDAYGNAIPLTQGAQTKGKQLTPAQAELLSEGKQLEFVLKPLEDLLEKNWLFGPVVGKARTSNPWDTTAQSANAQILAAAQIVGKYMEGGVLRAEDVPKYKAMLPNIEDTKEVATRKLENIRAMLRNKTQEYIADYARAGYDVSNFQSSNSSIGQAFDALGFNNVLGKTVNGLGSLSEKYESGGNPGAIGYDSTGGYSYGAFQLAHNNAKTFIDQSPYKQYFQGLTFNSPEWRNRWKQVAQQDPNGFYNAQKAYISKTHFEPQIQKLSSIGLRIDQLSPATLNAVWSTAVQHGPNTNIVLNAVKKLPSGATEADLIKQIYVDRWAGGKNFASSTPQVQQSVYNRFFGTNGELNMALSMLS